VDNQEARGAISVRCPTIEIRLAYLGNHRWRINRPDGTVESETTRAAAALLLATIFDGATAGREAAERGSIALEVSGAITTLAANPRMMNGWTFSSAMARGDLGPHEQLEEFVARWLAQHAEDAWDPAAPKPAPSPLSTDVSFAAFATAADPEALCASLAAILSERLRASTDPSATFLTSMNELRALGHDLWSWDEDRVWGHDYVTARTGAGLIVTRSGDDEPSEQDIEIEFRSGGNEVGCPHCWVEAGKKVVHGELTLDEPLFRESRFSVVLRRCPSCQEQFALVHCTLSQLSRDRDDAGTLTIPLAAAEVEALRAAGASSESAVEDFLRSLSPRKYTVTTGGPTLLVNGAIRILPHD
jgi:hypothetical protein